MKIIIKNILFCLIVLVLIGGSFSIRVMASPPDQTGGIPETQQQEVADVPENEITALSPQTDMALPPRTTVSPQTFPISLVHIEVDSTEKLNMLQELGFACTHLGSCDVEIEQSALAALKSYGFSYETLRNGVAAQLDPIINSPDALVYQYGGNDTDVAIPDVNDPYCGYAYSGVNITSAPTGALVDYVEYRVRVLHTWPSDLRLYIRNSQNVAEEIIWDFLGGSDDGGYDDDVENDDDIYLNHRVINSTFDGEPVNQEWYLDAYDCVAGDTGSIDYMEVWIWYDDGGASAPNLTPYSPSGWDLPIVPSSVMNTHSVNDLYTTMPTYIDWAVLNNGSANAVHAFSSCLLFDSSTSPLACWSTPDGLLINYYAYVTDWALNVTPSVGWHTLKLQVDYYNEVSESNENDNVWSYQFYWSPTQLRIYLPYISTNKFFEGPFEQEPNNKYHLANGPLRSGKNYQGYPDDSDDYFSFIAETSGAITINLTNHTGTGVQLLLYQNSIDNRVGLDNTAPYAINYSGAPGIYFVRIYTASGYNSTTPYTLQVTYP